MPRVKEAAISREEFETRLLALVPEGETAGPWLASAFGRTDAWAYQLLNGKGAISTATVTTLELLERVAELERSVSATNGIDHRAIENRIRIVHRRVKKLRRSLRDQVAGTLETAAELETLMARCLGE